MIDDRRFAAEIGNPDSEFRGVTGTELAAVGGGSQPVYSDWNGLPHRIIYGCGTMILADAMFPFSR